MHEPHSASLKAWVLLCLSLFAIYAGWAICTSRGFYADGSFFFVHIVTTAEALNYFDDSKHIRLFINLVNQFPLILLTKMGVAEPATLRVAFNTPLFLWNALLLALLWRSARRHGTYLVWSYAAVSYVATVLPSDIFAVNQARLAQTIYWGIIFFATAPKALRPGEKLALGLMVLVAFRSHEAVIVFGPLIALAAGLGWMRIKTDRPLRIVLGLSGLALTLYGLYWQSAHPVSDATAGFLSSYSGWTRGVWFHSNLFFSWSLVVMLAASMALAWGHTPAPPKLKKLMLLGYAILCVSVGAQPFFSPNTLAPQLEFSFRLLIPFGGAALAGLALLDQFFEAGRPRWDRSTVTVLLSSALLGQSVWQMANTAAWATLCEGTRQVLANAPQAVMPSSAVTNTVKAQHPAAAKYEWGWTWPAFSIALADDRTLRTVIAPDHHLEHFHASAKAPLLLHIPFGIIDSTYWNVGRVAATCQSTGSPTLLPCRD